ncbi:MAG: hypothetical protein ABUL60_21050, partial [Myxococcales bacterium]
MSAQEQISKLQGLLERIQKNASRPRASSPTTATVVAAPIAGAPAPFVAPPPFVAPAPYAPTSYVSSVPVSSVDPVDELLGGAPEASPLPVDVDVPLESVPPVAEIAASEPPEAEPIPLVSVSTAQAAPPPQPIDDTFALESEVSEVRVATMVREPAAEVTVEAIAAEAEPIGTEELSEEDLVEVTEGTPMPAATDVDIDFEDEEQPPASSQRSRVASSMDEALAAAAEQLDAEREVPLKTPPPESGPQAAPLPTGMAAPAAPDVDALLGGELEIPTRADAGVTTAQGPTPEQLGQTIDLEEARGPSLELAEQKGSDAPAPAPVEELEVPLPGPTMVGGYDENLQPPPEARDELQAHLRRQEDDIPPPPESLAQYPSVQPSAPAPEIVPVYEAAPAGPEVVARPIPMGSPESFGSVRESFRPSSFLELLDA